MSTPIQIAPIFESEPLKTRWHQEMSNKEQELKQLASDLVTNASNGLLLDYC